jgi:branched-chain amino acid transport system ATP-binding protein
MTFFSVAELNKSFGGLTAVDNVSLNVYEGDIVGVIGPNGAGKSTLFNCITGYLEPTSGEIHFRETPVTDHGPGKLSQEGLVRTFQEARVFPTMTVLDNVMVASQDHPGEEIQGALRRSNNVVEHETETQKRAKELIDDFNLKRVENEYASNISGGQRKLLDLCRALMVEPDLLLLDEPFAGVQEELVKEISSQITRLNENGVTVIIIEHGIETLVNLVDRIIVLDNGSIIADGEPESVVNKKEVIETYIGSVDQPAEVDN